MEMIYQCPHCNAEYQLAASMADSEAECPDCGEIITIPPLRLGPGVIIGGFRLEKHLGHGSMGDVFLATQLSMDRKVAVKLLPQAMTVVEESVNRFLHEVQTSAKMEHPNIVTAFDAGQDSGTYYLAMSYVEGDNFDDMVRDKGAIDEQMAIEVCVAAAKGLRYAWEEHRLLHRDIKPGNIMIDRHGTIKLMDMGISKSIHEDASLTVPGLVVGTPHYMSPEQAWSEDPIDFRSDLYAVGATLYMLVTGRPPYVGSSQSVFTMLIRPEPFPHPQTLKPELSDGLAALILTMMAANPDDRYQSWDELMDECRLVAAGQMPKRSQPARTQEPEIVPPAPTSMGDGDPGSSSIHRPGTKGTVSLSGRLKKRGPGSTHVSKESADPKADTEKYDHPPIQLADSEKTPSAEMDANNEGEMKLSSLGNAERIEPKVKEGGSGLKLSTAPPGEHEMPIGENSAVLEKPKLGAGSNTEVVQPPEPGKASGLKLKRPDPPKLPAPPDGVEDKKGGSSNRLPPKQDKDKKKGLPMAALIGPVLIVVLIGALGVVYMATRPDDPPVATVTPGSTGSSGTGTEQGPGLVNTPKVPPGAELEGETDTAVAVVTPPSRPKPSAEEIAAERERLAAEIEAEYAEQLAGVRVDERALARRLDLGWPVKSVSRTPDEIADLVEFNALGKAEQKYTVRNMEAEADNKYGFIDTGEYVALTYEKDGRMVTVDGLLKQVTPSRVRIGDTIVTLDDLDPMVAGRFNEATARANVAAYKAAESAKIDQKREAYAEQIRPQLEEAIYKDSGYVKSAGKWVPGKEIFDAKVDEEMERARRRLMNQITQSTYIANGYSKEGGQWVKTRW